VTGALDMAGRLVGEATPDIEYCANAISPLKLFVLRLNPGASVIVPPKPFVPMTPSKKAPGSKTTADLVAIEVPVPEPLLVAVRVAVTPETS